MKTILDVRRTIKEHGYTVQSFAKKHGLRSQNIIQNIIKGNPTIKKLTEISDKLGCDITDFFYPIDEENDYDKNTTPLLNLKENPTEQEIKDENSNNDVQLEEADKTKKDAQFINATAFCPHCGAKVRVGVVLMPE